MASKDLWEHKLVCVRDSPPPPSLSLSLSLSLSVTNPSFVLSLPTPQNLPRDALPDGSPIREKLATFKRPKKYKTSENDFSHGSFFLRIGGIGKGKF